MTDNQADPDTDALFRSAIALVGSDDDAPGAHQYWRVIQMLHRRSDRVVFDRAGECCRSASQTERIVGVDVLAQLGHYEQDRGRPFTSETVPLLRQLLNDDSVAVVNSAIHALSHHQAGEASDLRGLASHPSRDVRWAVAGAMRCDDDPNAVPVLLNLMKDEDAGVRDWATFFLGTQSDADSTEIRAALTVCLSDPDLEVRCEAMVGLARRNDSSVIPYIVEALSRGDATQLVFDAADEILKTNPNQILAALEKWRTE